MTRFVVLSNYHGLIAGMDMDSVFKPNTVYEATEIMGEIILREVGPSCTPKKDRRKFSQVITNGRHLFTEEEKKALIEKEGHGPRELSYLWGDGSDE